jgi:electron transfer flavoprotein alpha subunit
MRSLKIVVFTKQVPDVAEMHFNPENYTLIREGTKNIINPYDRRAISEAIKIRNEFGGEVVVATMGPPQARDALLEALFMGADRAIHIQDPALAGSDTLVTAKVLAAAARRIGFDLIFVGQHSTDSETGQVPYQIAEVLQIPAASACCKLEYKEDAVIAHSETDEGLNVLELPYPAVISTAERLIKPIKSKDFDPSTAPAASAEKIETWNLERLGISKSEVGLSGSPTWVAGIREVHLPRANEIVDGSDPKIAAKKIVQAIRERPSKPDAPMIPSFITKGDRQFWVFIEQFQGRIRTVSLEMIGNAAQLADRGGKVSAIIIGDPVRTQDVLLLGAFGADRIYHATDTAPHPDDVVELLSQRIQILKPYAFFLPATPQGRELASRIAGRLHLGLTGDCVGLRLDAQGKLEQLKPAEGGNILASIFTRTEPKLATIRAGALPSFRPRTGNQIPVIEWSLPPYVNRRFKILESKKDAGSDAVKMDSALSVICVGMGLGQENVPLATRLADLLHGAVGATRRVVDAGWLQRQFQVGLTGRFIAPEVYIGLGVSGRPNHTIGIRKSGRIIAVNKDPNAEIFKNADLGVVGDSVDITKELIALLES